MPHSYKTVLIERNPAGYAVLTLNRPEKLNALSIELRDELAAALAELRREAAVRVLILTGAGRAFCAGLDLNELSSGPSNSARAFELDVVSALLQFEGPVIGAINGVAATGGFELAMACDILLASTAAQFADTHAKVGLLPGWGLSVRLPRRIGLHRAKEMAFTARFFRRPRRKPGAWSIASCRPRRFCARRARWRWKCSPSCRKSWSSTKSFSTGASAGRPARRLSASVRPQPKPTPRSIVPPFPDAGAGRHSSMAAHRMRAPVGTRCGV